MNDKYLINDICDVGSSKRIYLSEYQANGIPFYRGKEIIEKDSNRDISNELFISYERYNEIKEKFGVPVEGDILMTAVGTIGVSWYVNESNFYFKDGNLIWFKNFKKDKVNSKYLYYIFKSKMFSEIIRNISIGSTQKAITIEQVKKIHLNFPKIDIQNRIVNILDGINDKIRINNEINNNLSDQIRSIYKEIFIQYDDYKRLDEISNVTIGKTPPRSEHECFTTDKKDIKWISIGDLGKSGMFIFDTSEKLTKEAVEKYNVRVIPKDAVILSFKLTVGRTAFSTEDMTTNEAIAHFNLNNKELNNYLYCYLTYFNYSDLGSTSSIATAINSKIVKSIMIGIPSEEQLNRFNKLTSSMFELIKSNEKENIKLSELRDTLLPKLMNGEIDLDNIEI